MKIFNVEEWFICCSASHSSCAPRSGRAVGLLAVIAGIFVVADLLYRPRRAHSFDLAAPPKAEYRHRSPH
jgi:hypothetical protein